MSRALTRTTAPPESVPHSTARRPAFVDTVDDVTPMFDDDLGCEIFRVALANGDGGSMSIVVTGDELRSFRKFHTALRERDVRFADKGRFTGRRGADWWQTDIYNLAPELFDSPDGEPA